MSATARVRLARCGCFALASSAVGALAVEVLRAPRFGGDMVFTVWLVVAYAAFSTAGVATSESFTANHKAALIAACFAIAALLPVAVIGRLGVLSLPLIVFGPSLPFVVVARLAHFSPEPDDDGDDPSPTLSLLLRGKRYRAAAATGFQKPVVRHDERFF